jgi:filamentous hemagglutinin
VQVFGSLSSILDAVHACASDATTHNAAHIANAGKEGNTLLNAERNLNVATVTTASSNSIIWDPVRYRKKGSSTDVGAIVQGAGAITFQAGADITLRAARVDAGGVLSATAGANVNILAGAASTTFDQTSQTTKSGFLHHETITTRNTLDAKKRVLRGATVNLSAGNDLKVVGASLSATRNTACIRARWGTRGCHKLSPNRR